MAGINADDLRRQRCRCRRRCNCLRRNRCRRSCLGSLCRLIFLSGRCLRGSHPLGIAGMRDGGSCSSADRNAFLYGGRLLCRRDCLGRRGSRPGLSLLMKIAEEKPYEHTGQCNNDCQDDQLSVIDTFSFWSFCHGSAPFPKTCSCIFPAGSALFLQKAFRPAPLQPGAPSGTPGRSCRAARGAKHLLLCSAASHVIRRFEAQKINTLLKDLLR